MMKWTKRIRRWTWAHRLTALAFLALLILGSLDSVTWFRGSASGTTLLNVIPFTDPLAMLEATIASRQLHIQAMIGAGILLVAAALLGPIFCGWVCPLGLMLDVIASLRAFTWRRLGGRRLPPIPKPARIEVKFAILGLVLGFALFGRLPLFQILSPINILASGVIFPADVGLVIVAIIIVVELVRPRIWCRTLCPLGALYSLVGRFSLLRVRINADLEAPKLCGQCVRRCPMAVPITDQYIAESKRSIDHPNCTRCGECIDDCPRGVLTLGFRSRRAE
ncbi:MAG: 4Fe-4S binding protein [Phycisphaerales bacterium]|nr:4Fe-4S binding protein [Phycisphaerales bacterium]